ncbi:MAG: hypothetical protein QY326_01285 [Bdellovibrionota bacterium]|nr:MAG: hypothetical protein QY326_01285 [Bdellovibrionota bacterium]
MFAETAPELSPVETKAGPISPRLSVAALLFSSGLAWMLLALIAAPLHLWDSEGALLISGPLSGSVIGLLACIGGYVRRNKAEALLCVEPFVLGLLLLLCSDWLNRSYNFYQGPLIRGELLVLFLAALVMLRQTRIRTLRVLPIVASLLCVYVFFYTAKGNWIVSDDHPSFVYRLMLLWRHFPDVPIYYPLWNAGIEYREYFGTGVLGPFLLGAPLFALLSYTDAYTVLVALILFVVVPTSSYIAARVCTLSTLSAAIASTLALGSSLLWYRWGLKYGTMGFVTAVAFAPMVIACAARLYAARNEVPRLLLWIFGVASSFTIFWPAAAFIILPALVYVAMNCAALLRMRRFIILTLVMLAIHLPWMVLFWNVSSVGSIITNQWEQHREHNPLLNSPRGKVTQAPVSVQRIVRPLYEASHSTNPLILMLLVPGLLLISRRGAPVYAATTLWLLFLGTVGNTIKPHLELDRMLLVLAFLGCVPVAVAVEAVVVRRRIVGAIAMAAVTLVPFATAAVVGNRSIEQYTFENGDRRRMRDFLRELETPGRIVFSGFVLHELNESHLASLPIETGKALVASTPFHNKWRYDEVIPAAFLRRGSEGIEAFLDLLNASVVIAHEPNWVSYFRGAASYRERLQIGKFVIFDRSQASPSYVVEGSADIVEILENGVRLIPRSDSVILKFLYHPQLVASPCKVEAQSYEEVLDLVRLEHCTPGQEVFLKLPGPWRRLFQ